MLPKDIRKEILKMTAAMLAVSVVTVLAFYLLGYGGRPVIYGALLGAATAALNYFLLALTVSIACRKGGNGTFNGYMSISYTVRILLLGAVIIFAIKCKSINYIAAVIPLIFPRFFVTVFGILEKKKSKKETDDSTKDYITEQHTADKLGECSSERATDGGEH